MNAPSNANWNQNILIPTLSRAMHATACFLMANRKSHADGSVTHRRLRILFSICLISFVTAFQSANISPQQPRQAHQASNNDDIILMPPPGSEKKIHHAALILVPGCLLQPWQYEPLAKVMQQESQQQIWIGISKQIFDFANPHTIAASVESTFLSLRRAGYRQNSAFVGGHSLGGAFLPFIFDRLGVDKVEGLIHIGCILARSRTDDPIVQSVPHLVCAGDLDGLVRSSRIAEDYYRNNVVVQNQSDPLHHTVITVPGLNHFAIVATRPNEETTTTTPTSVLIPNMLEGFRDIESELSFDSAIRSVGKTVAEFIDCHGRTKCSISRANLSVKMDYTVKYLGPILDAMKLEGSYHLAKPCHLCEEGDVECHDACIQGSSWVSKVQTDILPNEINYGEILDEFHQSWWINPLADPPFYHPEITVRNKKGLLLDNDTLPILDLTTMSEPVYEKPDYYLFDAGFFSNTAIEIRSKLHSKQSLLRANGKNVPFQSECGICSDINQKTIEWALETAPEQVRQRYLTRGVQLVAGNDNEHDNGPSWIWTHLEFRRVTNTTMAVDSQIMSTSLDHPFPFSQGKLYCKLLSPAKALDWMYTDSLRKSTPVNNFASRLYNEELLSPVKFFKRIQVGANQMPFFPLVVLNQLVNTVQRDQQKRKPY